MSDYESIQSETASPVEDLKAGGPDWQADLMFRMMSRIVSLEKQVGEKGQTGEPPINSTQQEEVASILQKVGEGQSRCAELMTKQMSDTDDMKYWPYLANIIPKEKELSELENSIRDKDSEQEYKQKLSEMYDGKLKSKTINATDAMTLAYLLSDDASDRIRLAYLILHRTDDAQRINLHNVSVFGKLKNFRGKERRERC
eukprot:Tbor_TRINITY_DN5507_c1_g3::TRINITY_DN5507_c1_g3_i1::g.12905::m.12905